MKNIFVLGSCVSRDAFALDESKDCRLVGYLARTSFASSFHDQAVKGIDLSSIPSMFQKRMVENDLLKKTKSVLINTKFDWLVIDLIDERFSIFVSDEQEIITLSPELENNCKIDKEGSVLHPSSEEMMEYWKDGWGRFIDFATQNKFLHKIVLNKVFWTSQTDKEEKVVASAYQSWFDGNNRWLQKLYAHIETVGGVKVLEHPGELLIADSNHKWGLQPYHYTKPLYLHLLDYLGQMQAYQHALERGIIYTDFLPLTLETLPIQRHGMFDCEPLIFQGGRRLFCDHQSYSC